MKWGMQQESALDAAGRWLSSGQGGVFRLFGFAGSGKTTLAKHLAEGAGNTIYGAFTGKAAHVMQAAGCEGAQTLHSLIYHPSSKSKERLRRLQEELDEVCAEYGIERDYEAPPARVIELEAEIEDEKINIRRPSFTLNLDSSLKEADLLVVDECSMVNEAVAEDLLSFDVPILALGDPAQLPPVFGGGFFTDHAPDAMLTEIHRQARDNPIIDMATRVRNGEHLPHGIYGDSRVLPVSSFVRQRDEISAAVDQVIVGKNDTRRRANQRMRIEGGNPVAIGERLVCLRNNNTIGLLNGSIWTVEGFVNEGETVKLDLRDEDSGRELTDVEAWHGPFAGEEVDPCVKLDAEEFDYGYALTCHKAQGSQFPRVLIVDESHVFRKDAKRWLYTAITRAAEQVTIVS